MTGSSCQEMAFGQVIGKQLDVNCIDQCGSMRSKAHSGEFMNGVVVFLSEAHEPNLGILPGRLRAMPYY